MNTPRITFHGHACFQIDVGDTTLLCDPWMSGTVFNDSWAHLHEHPLNPTNFQRQLIIWISHEHPDHLHFPTLRFIREKVNGKIQVLYRKQVNSNVKEAVSRLGFEFVELEEGVSLKVARSNYSYQFSLQIGLHGRFRGWK